MCTILYLLNWNFWWIIMVPHHCGGNMLAQVWSLWVKTFPHISQMKYLLSIICIFWESHNFPIYGKTRLQTTTFIWNTRHESGKTNNYKYDICHIESCLHFICSFWHCAFSCGSSAALTLCRSSCIACRQKVSRRCVKACDTSDHWGNWKRSCTDYIQMAVLQCGWACGSWEH